MTYPYKCNRCRTRNIFKKKLEDYVRPKKCKACGYDRFYFDKDRARRVKPCNCSGYNFPHRVGSPCCEKNQHCMTNRAKREGLVGDDLLEAIAEDAWGSEKKPWGEDPPF